MVKILSESPRNFEASLLHWKSRWGGTTINVAAQGISCAIRSASAVFKARVVFIWGMGSLLSSAMRARMQADLPNPIASQRTPPQREYLACSFQCT